MNQISDFISANLDKFEIRKNFSKEIDRMFEVGILNQKMSQKGCYSAFLLEMTKENPLFLRILKGEYLFDIKFLIKNSIFDENVKFLSENEKIDYFYHESSQLIKNENSEEDTLKYFVGIKFKPNIFKDYLEEYKLLENLNFNLNDLIFLNPVFHINNSLLSEKDPSLLFLELVQHLKGLKLPLLITDCHIRSPRTNITNIFDCYIELQNSNWPEDLSAISIAKSAFYCDLYSKSSFRHFIHEDYCVFKYGNIFFKIKILIKRDFNKKIITQFKIDSIMKSVDCDFINKIRLLKQILLGFYPIIDDFTVDSICLMIKSTSYTKFISDFFDLLSSFSNDQLYSLNLQSLKIETEPKKTRFNGFRLLHDCFYNISINSKNLLDSYSSIRYYNPNSSQIALCNLFKLIENLENFTFVLSASKYDQTFSEIIGAVGGDLHLIFPEIEQSVIFKFIKETSCLYDPINGLLMVDVKDGFDVDLIINMFICSTSFTYIKIN